MRNSAAASVGSDSIELDPFLDRAAVQVVWEKLAGACRPSYFLAWPWVENWLSTLPASTDLKLLTLREEGEPVAAAFIGRRTLLRSRVVPSRGVFLNATGWDEFDEICVEHNGWLAARPVPLGRLVGSIGGAWDELFLDAMDVFAEDEPAVPAWPVQLRVRERRPCYVVDLDKVRAATNADYLSLLGGELRSQIKRSYKLYQARGPITVESAKRQDEAREILEELVALHQLTWKSRGKPGAFAEPYFLRFHQRLIENRLERGEVQLVRIRAGTHTLGCLYNFVWNGTVSFYQSGVAYEPDNRLKPGLLCHAEAVRHNASLGMSTYDFLGGDARYKRGLSTGSTELVWATVQRPRLRFLAEDCARAFLTALKHHQTPPSGPASGSKTRAPVALEEKRPSL